MLKGQAKKDYQKEYQRKHQREYRLRRKGSNQGLLTGSNQDVEGSNQVKAKLEAAGITLDGNKLSIESKPREYIPRYNPSIHKQGDKVLINGQVVIVPELDADGSPL